MSLPCLCCFVGRKGHAHTVTSSAIHTYTDFVFYAYPQGAKNVEFTVQHDQRVYWFEDDSTLPEVREALEKELEWMRDYKARTGREWVGTAWPRPPITYDMWQPKVSCMIALHTQTISNSSDFTSLRKLSTHSAYDQPLLPFCVRRLLYL